MFDFRKTNKSADNLIMFWSVKGELITVSQSSRNSRSGNVKEGQKAEYFKLSKNTVVTS